MSKRMLDTSIWANEHFADLPPMGRLLLIGIITLADDQGRCKANPAYLRSQVFPYDDIDTDAIGGWLHQLAEHETIYLYQANGKAYLQMPNWWMYQPLDWARPSEHPAPDGWQDRIRYNAKGGVHLTYNWTTKTGAPMPDTCDSRGNPLGAPTRTTTKPPTNAAPTVPTQVPTQVPTPSTNADKVDIDQIRYRSEVVVPAAETEPEPTTTASHAWNAFLDNVSCIIGPMDADKFNALLDDYGESAVYRGMEIMVERKPKPQRSLGYLAGILKRGIDTPTPGNSNGYNSKAMNAMIATAELVQEYRERR